MRTRLILAAVLILRVAFAQEITTPEKFFGFQLGADKKMARWDKIVEYYGVLEKQSGGRMKVINMGPTSEGNPFLMVIITSPANLAKLDRYREVNAAHQRPARPDRGGGPHTGRRGQSHHRAIQSMHATEIGGTQMAPELAYDLLARKDEETQRILDNVIYIEVPCFNPDGEIMVTDWYNKTLGTPYEGTNPPWLYQKYAGHDNNRDAFQTNMPDSQYMAKILFTDWRPEAYVDHHQHGRQRRADFPAALRRADPALRRPDPLARAELVRRAHGVQRGRGRPVRRHQRRQYSGWGHFGLALDHALPQHRRHAHRVRRAHLATPQFVHPDELRGEHAQPAGLRSPKPSSPIRGRADGGICATSSTGRKSPLGRARSGRAQPRNGPLERLSEGQAPDRARRRRQAGRIPHLHAAARSADRRSR